MTASQRTIARVRRRLVLQRGLRLAGWTLLTLAAVAAVTLVVAQAVGFAVPGVWHAWAGGGALAVAVGVGLVAARSGEAGGGRGGGAGGREAGAEGHAGHGAVCGDAG